MRTVRMVQDGSSSPESVEVGISASDRLIESNGRVQAFTDGETVEPMLVAVSGKTAWVWHRGGTFEFHLQEPARVRRPGVADDSEFRAPMPGRIVRLCVGENEPVARGATLLILEAMKMEHEIKAPRSGRVGRFLHAAGAQVDAGSELLDFEVGERDV